ncbi:MAG: hypothetical protein V1794_09490 [Candidatus Glassbacteria bacterium]
MTMDIFFSSHACKRISQRGITTEIAELIVLYGTPRPKPGGVDEYTISKEKKNQIIRKAKNLIQNLDKVSGKAVLVSSNSNEVITAYTKS